MMTRRSFCAAAAYASACIALGESARAEGVGNNSFKVLLAEALKHPELLLAARGEREAQSTTRSALPKYPPSNHPISKDAVALIVAFEVSSARAYESRYVHPIWPGLNSGVTIGIGYDLGWTQPGELRQDWANLLPEPVIAALVPACGLRGEAANSVLKSVSSVAVPWDEANNQFTTRSLPRYASETLHVHHNTYALPGDSFGALLSLVYNRGDNFQTPGDRYKEMRAIFQCLVLEEYARIPGQIRAMSRLWESPPNSVPGLVIRRQLEAALFEQGLSSTSTS
jgi:GH24 family phage-related lysozyme (muramidase)